MTSEDMTNIDRLTIGEIMGEDMDVWLKKDNQEGFRIVIDNEDGKTIIDDTINRYCARSFAHFCRRFVSFYDQAVEEPSCKPVEVAA